MSWHCHDMALQLDGRFGIQPSGSPRRVRHLPPLQILVHETRHLLLPAKRVVLPPLGLPLRFVGVDVGSAGV